VRGRVRSAQSAHWASKGAEIFPDKFAQQNL
jgi:hypothetical protein